MLFRSRTAADVLCIFPLVDSSLPAFTAVLLAGGKSTRMGRDKAGVVVGGEPLWQRQLATLCTCGPRELFISGRPEGPYAGAGAEVIADATPGLGPLAGLEAALRRANCPLVLVLAIDLPAMTAEFLSSLIREAARDEIGGVPSDGDFLEPLAAVYPRTCHELAAECLQSNDRSMRHFIRLATERGQLRPRPLSPDERLLFKNVNRPEDLDAV
jgi:molybdopterin-guanine dinucleotide biosynthesis protein A